MKIKRTAILLTSFVIITLINLILIFSYITYREIAFSQKRILSDLERIDRGETGTLTVNTPPLITNGINAEVKLVDGRSANLKRYLRSINSPLFEYADVLVAEADDKGYDYKLLVAIALQESSGCKFIPEGSYNCWGWGIYGDTVTKFDSYEDGIMTVSNGIKKNYIDHGLITTEAIMRKYTPSSPGTWAQAVRYFFRRIDDF